MEPIADPMVWLGETREIKWSHEFFALAPACWVRLWGHAGQPLTKAEVKRTQAHQHPEHIPNLAKTVQLLPKFPSISSSVNFQAGISHAGL